MALLLVALVGAAVAGAAAPPPVGGAVACATPEGVAAGLEVLRAGGNAVDAAVAVALALAVTHPEAGNLGGGGFAVVRLATGEVSALDFRETAPAAATAAMFLDERGEVVAGASLVGPLAAGVPGTPSGLFVLHRELGALPWARVVAPAAQLARDGFAVSARLAASLAAERALLERFPETAAVWLPGGAPPAVGRVICQPQLAATHRRSGLSGPAASAPAAAAAVAEAAARRHGGILTAADLTAYRPVWREPLRFAAFGWQVASMPLPSSGGIILGQTLGLLERRGWREQSRGGADRAHLLAESWRQAFADRFLLGDPAVSRASERELLAPAWLDLRAAAIRTAAATPSSDVRPWSPEGGGERPETTHLSVADGAGTVVALTTTLNGRFGCGLVVPGLGFLLNNEMDDFATAAGRPNQFGLIQGEANQVAPGRRMLSSMSPTVAWRDERVVALGSPGGSTIPTVTGQVLLGLIVDGDSLQAAVDRPRLHHQWLPDQLRAEPGALSEAVAAELVRRGHRVVPVPSLGLVNAVEVTAGGAIAAADPRGPEAAGVISAGHGAGR